MPLRFEKIVNGPFQENCYLAWDDTDNRGVLIDPGAEPERLMGVAEKKGVRLEAVYNTHGHIDHAGGVEVIKQKLGIPFAMHKEDEFLLALLPDQARMFGVASVAVPTVDIALHHDDDIQVGGCKGRVIHTPGHTPGGVCFHFDDALFVGDTLFAGSIGRTDLPGGSLQELLTAIKERLLILDETLVVLSGHGPDTTIGEEKRYNPFLTGRF